MGRTSPENSKTRSGENLKVSLLVAGFYRCLDVLFMEILAGFWSLFNGGLHGILMAGFHGENVRE